jgi:hypothetical protein
MTGFSEIIAEQISQELEAGATGDVPARGCLSKSKRLRRQQEQLLVAW